MKQYLDQLKRDLMGLKKSSITERLSVFIAVLVVMIIVLTVNISIVRQGEVASSASSKNGNSLVKSSYIAQVFVTPTIYCLGSCPTIILTPISSLYPTQTVTPTRISVQPPQLPTLFSTTVNPSSAIPSGGMPTVPISQGPIPSSAPSIFPCSSLAPNQANAYAAANRRIQVRRNGGISGWFQQLWQFIQQFIDRLLQRWGMRRTPTTPLRPNPSIQPTQAAIPTLPNQPTQPVISQPTVLDNPPCLP